VAINVKSEPSPRFASIFYSKSLKELILQTAEYLACMSKLLEPSEAREECIETLRRGFQGAQKRLLESKILQITVLFPSRDLQRIKKRTNGWIAAIANSLGCQ
jgi:hypothetical protein